MAITVGDIFTQFPGFRPDDMITLMGCSDYNGRTQVSLGKIAHYNGTMAKELSVFTAGKEGKTYLNMLSENSRAEISLLAGINETENNSNEKNTDKSLLPKIPMGKSVFDIKNEEPEKMV